MIHRTTSWLPCATWETYYPAPQVSSTTHNSEPACIEAGLAAIGQGFIQTRPGYPGFLGYLRHTFGPGARVFLVPMGAWVPENKIFIAYVFI